MNHSGFLASWTSLQTHPIMVSFPFMILNPEPQSTLDPLSPILYGNAPSLLLEQTPEGWAGLYCYQGRENAEETLAHLALHYPDGLARLQPLGDLITLGGTPEHCEAMEADGEYAPARDPEYPPATEPDLHQACVIWNRLKAATYACLYLPGAGWSLADPWGRPLA